ncbi:MAG: sigma-70 family RNA polymerase sigma factor [Granulosicoccaceae bacterium]
MATLQEEQVAAEFKKALAGDMVIYRELLQKITPVIRGVVHSKLPSFDAASVEDVVQEVLLAIHSKRQTWQQDKPLLPWIYAIARYKSIDALRAQNKGEAGADLDIDEIDELEAPPSTLEQNLDVQAAVDKLDGKLASVVRAIGIEGVSVSEAGDRLAMSENAVRVAFHRGLKQLVGLRTSLMGEP